MNGDHGGGASVPEIVLLLEDNVIILMDTEETLRELGVGTVMTATSAAEALALIHAQRPAFALLDIDLGTGTSFEVAERLDSLGVPFAFSTGFADTHGLPANLIGRPRILKPYSADDLRALIKV